jgi:hypothetical protein
VRKKLSVLVRGSKLLLNQRGSRRKLAGSLLFVGLCGMVLSACGSSSSAAKTSTTTTTKATAPVSKKASKEATNFEVVSGSVASVTGQSVEVTTSKGKALVVLTSSTRLSQLMTVTSSAITQGVCVSAVGPANSIGVIQAKTILLRPPATTSATNATSSSGSPGNPCLPEIPAKQSKNFQHFAAKFKHSGFSGHGQYQPGSSSEAGSSFAKGAFGEVTAIQGTTLEVLGASGQVGVDLLPTTQILEMSSAIQADVAPGKCIMASGEKTANGSVSAREVTLSSPEGKGCTRFPGFGRF